MILVVDGAVGAEGIAHAVQAEEIALALIGIHMNLARNEVISSQQRFQPWRPKILAPHSHKRTHLHSSTSTIIQILQNQTPKLRQIKRESIYLEKGSFFISHQKRAPF